MSVAFDILTYAKKLKQAGMEPNLAEVQAEALAEIIEEKIATKQDLRELEYRLTIKLGAMLVVAIGIFATLVKLL